MNTRQVTVRGLRPIMFDRFAGLNEQLEPMNKVYLDQKGELVFPAINILSFLSCQNAESAAQRVMGKKWKTVAKAALSFVDVEPFEIPFLREGKVLTRENAGLYVRVDKAIVKKGALCIPNPKERPVLNLPWELQFKVTLMDNPNLTEDILKRLFVEGGIAIGFGTFRGVFGKFEVVQWD